MSDTPKKDEASMGGGDVPERPLDPATAGSGAADPVHDGDGVHLYIPTEDEADEAEGHPT